MYPSPPTLKPSRLEAYVRHTPAVVILGELTSRVNWSASWVSYPQLLVKATCFISKVHKDAAEKARLTTPPQTEYHAALLSGYSLRLLMKYSLSILTALSQSGPYMVSLKYISPTGFEHVRSRKFTRIHTRTRAFPVPNRPSQSDSAWVLGQGLSDVAS